MERPSSAYLKLQQLAVVVCEPRDKTYTRIVKSISGHARLTHRQVFTGELSAEQIEELRAYPLWFFSIIEFTNDGGDAA